MKHQKGFIQIPLLIGIIVSIVAVSVVTTGVVLHKQGKLSSITASVSHIFKGTENIEPEVKSEKSGFQEESSVSESQSSESEMEESESENQAKREMTFQPEPEPESEPESMIGIETEEEISQIEIEQESQPESKHESEPEVETNPCVGVNCSNCQYCNLGSCINYCQNTDNNCGCANCVNCNNSDGCSGSNYLDYYCSNNSCIHTTDNCSDCSCSCGGYNTDENIANGNCSDGKDNNCDGNIDSEDIQCIEAGSQYPYISSFSDNLGNEYKKKEGQTLGGTQARHPISPGITITFMAEGIDPDGDEVLYKFYLNNRYSETIQDWSSKNTYSVTITEEDVGEIGRFVDVLVKDKNSYYRYENYDDSSRIVYKVQPPSIAPKIYNIAIKDINDTSATITFETDIDTEGTIDYGTLKVYAEHHREEVLTTDHFFVLKDLSPDTVYHFRVVAIDEKKWTSVSDDFTFTTKPNTPPKIFNIEIEHISPSSLFTKGSFYTRISWEIDEPTSDSRVEFGRVEGIYLEGDYVSPYFYLLRETHQSVEIKQLLPNTKYFYRIIAYDTAENESIKTGSFETPSARISNGTIKVPQDYEKIQDAIDIAQNGDTILVAPGTYAESLRIAGKVITLKSTDGPEVTAITGNGYNTTIGFGKESSPAVLEGFTISNIGGSDVRGAGIEIGDASPIIKNNIIERNLGGIRIGYESSPLVISNVIQNNIVSGGYGGGISITCRDCEPIISQNTIRNNFASIGGGISVEKASTILINNTITNNEVKESGKGAGIAFLQDSQSGSIMQGNTVENNYGADQISYTY